MKNARVYNLYPYLLKDFQSWIDKLDDVNFMNFIEFVNNHLFNLISEISIGQGKDDIIEYCDED